MLQAALCENRYANHSQTSICDSQLTVLNDSDLDLIAGGYTKEQYNKAAAVWAGVAAVGGLFGQPEVVFAAGVMSSYDWYMGS